MRIYRNHITAFLGELETVYTQASEMNSRNGKCKEVLFESFRIHRPLERCLLMHARNDNIFHKIAETLWVISGRNDMAFLEYYLPRCKEWSDDGEVWRAGYGPRIRMVCKYDVEEDYYEIDQIAECVRLLNNDPNTRRAVISLWDPFTDYEYSKDIPCNNWLHWIIRDGKLHLNIAQRSSDVWWGLSGINLFEWSVLMQMMAHWTGTQVGSMNYNITSLHIYEPMWEKAFTVLNENDRWIYDNTAYNHGLNIPEFRTSFDRIDRKLDTVFRIEHDMRRGLFATHVYDTAGLLDPFLETCMEMLCLYSMHKQGFANVIPTRINSMEPSDFRLAAIHYFLRQYFEELGSDFLTMINLTEQEKSYFNLETVK